MHPDFNLISIFGIKLKQNGMFDKDLLEKHGNIYGILHEIKMNSTAIDWFEIEDGIIIGIPAGYPWKMDKHVLKLETEEEAEEYVINAVKPYLAPKTDIEAIIERVDYFHGTNRKGELWSVLQGNYPRYF